MLKINFLNEEATIETIKEFADAVRFESCDMTKRMNLDSISKYNKIVANENGKYDDADVEHAQKKIEDLEKINKELSETLSKIEDVYKTVIVNMTKPNEKGFANNEDAVKTVLRVIACAENSKLYKYAISPSFKDADLHECLESIHINNTVTDTGYSTMSKERKALYKKAQDRLDEIMRNTFSLPIATDYTLALKVKLNASDRKMIHDVYVKGFSNEIKTDKKTGASIFVSRKYNTAVKKVKGEVVYDGLSKDLAKLVIAKYAK